MRKKKTRFDWVDYKKYVPSYRVETGYIENMHIKITIVPTVESVYVHSMPPIKGGIFGYNPSGDIEMKDRIEVSILSVTGVAANIVLKNYLENFLIEEYEKINAKRIMRATRSGE